ncbi:MAG: glycogen synthase GlgA [Vicinamibacterales bacterium]
MAARAARPLRILMIASEAFPFSKTGGLADVATALPRAIARLGHDVTLVTPRYHGVGGGEKVGSLTVDLAAHSFNVELLEAPSDSGARTLLVDCPELYDRTGIYGERGADYGDNPLRYAVLSAVALRWALSQPEPPQIVHGHDWQSGLALAYLRPMVSRLALPPVRNPPRTVFTIHNLAYQGLFDKHWVPRLLLGWEGFTVRGFEFWDRVSFLKSGVNFADRITTVSPTYADEIQRPEYGEGFDGIIRARRDVLVGILNGIDVTEWNAAADRFLPAPFDADHLAGKGAAKRALLERFRLPTDEASLARPVIGMVSRMASQKGLDLIAAAAHELVALDASIVVVGSGEARYQEMWNRLAQARRDRIGVFIGYDEERAHLVEGGADIFLMPSRFEPCGLNQMYSMRYGTVPVVRAVGGLVDTVKPYDPRNGRGTGFLFAAYQPGAMMHALANALGAFRNKKMWTRLQKNGMRSDFSWDRSADEYVTVYKRVLYPRRKAGI